MTNYYEVYPLPVNHISGFRISVPSTTQLTIDAGTCKDSTNSFDITLKEAVTLTATYVGVNGIDTGALEASTVYAVYVIADPKGFNPVKTLLSKNASTPYLPFGYGLYRRIGWAITDGAAEFLVMVQTGSQATRTYWFDVAEQVLAAGTDTTLTPVSLLGTVPAINTKVFFNALFTSPTPGSTAQIAAGTSLSPTVGMTAVVAAVTQAVQLQTVANLVSSEPTINYIVSAGSLVLEVTAFEDYL